jgi:hypothetical protein
MVTFLTRQQYGGGWRWRGEVGGVGMEVENPPPYPAGAIRRHNHLTLQIPGAPPCSTATPPPRPLLDDHVPCSARRGDAVAGGASEEVAWFYGLGWGCAPVSPPKLHVSEKLELLQFFFLNLWSYSSFWYKYMKLVLWNRKIRSSCSFTSHCHR